MNDKILAAGNKNINRFFALDSSGFEDGAIPSKYKELMGLTASLILRCNDCIFYHVDSSVTAGANKEELLEAMNIGLVIGGSSVIPHLRYAFDVYDDLTKDD